MVFLLHSTTRTETCKERKYRIELKWKSCKINMKIEVLFTLVMKTFKAIIFYGYHFSAISINFISLFSNPVFYVCLFAYHISLWWQLKLWTKQPWQRVAWKGSFLHFLEKFHRMYLITVIKKFMFRVLLSSKEISCFVDRNWGALSKGWEVMFLYFGLIGYILYNFTFLKV